MVIHVNEELTSFHSVLEDRVVFSVAEFAAAQIISVQSLTFEIVGQTVEKVDFIVVNAM